MINRQIKIASEDGLKARLAAIFVQEASKYDCQILMEYENMKVNAKSIMGVLSLGLKNQDEFFLLANGADEAQAVETLTQLLQDPQDE